MPRVRITVGVHPHNARHYNDELEQKLRGLLADPRVGSLGEIGLNYHYDLSPRETQRDVFRRQIRLAKETGLPISLHIREAHDEALAILHEEGFPEAGTLLHCCSLGPDEIKPWIEAGCYIAFGGAITFGNAEAAREGAKLVPLDRVLTETDAPFMAPVPLRGTTCEPNHVAFTLAKLAEVRGETSLAKIASLQRRIADNANELLNRAPTEWQVENAAK